MWWSIDKVTAPLGPQKGRGYPPDDAANQVNFAPFERGAIPQSQSGVETQGKEKPHFAFGGKTHALQLLNGQLTPGNRRLSPTLDVFPGIRGDTSRCFQYTEKRLKKADVLVIPVAGQPALRKVFGVIVGDGGGDVLQRLYTWILFLQPLFLNCPKWLS